MFLHLLTVPRLTPRFSLRLPTWRQVGQFQKSAIRLYQGAERHDCPVVRACACIFKILVFEEMPRAVLVVRGEQYGQLAVEHTLGGENVCSSRVGERPIS